MVWVVLQPRCLLRAGSRVLGCFGVVGRSGICGYFGGVCGEDAEGGGDGRGLEGGKVGETGDGGGAGAGEAEGVGGGGWVEVGEDGVEEAPGMGRADSSEGGDDEGEEGVPAGLGAPGVLLYFFVSGLLYT